MAREQNWPLKKIQNLKSTRLMRLIRRFGIDKSKKKSFFTSNSPASAPNCYSAARAIFPNLALSDFTSISEKAVRSELIKSLSDKACGPRIKIDRLQVKSETALTDNGKKKVFALIDEQLNKQNIVSIVYNSSLLMDIDSTKQANHASVVVGRKFNPENGECEYLIRNSWGRGCRSYDPKLRCEEGNIWVPKSVLIKGGLLNATYID